MPEEGSYLLAGVGFSTNEKPVLIMQRGGQFVHFEPLGATLTLRFSGSERFCIGWHDLATSELFSCPDVQTIEPKYEQCSGCQQRTGFNPAFYNANSVSSQQEARNQEPHTLYLARFGKGVIKVGISHAKRGMSRLLEQGARDALILDTFPTAQIARQYEAKIAALPGIIEALQLRKKLALINTPYNHHEGKDELIKAKEAIEEVLKIRFDSSEVKNLDPIFFPNGAPNLLDSYCPDAHRVLSGRVVGSLGTLLFCQYNDTAVYLPLKKYIGYHVELLYTTTSLDLPARQTSLF